MSGARSFLNPVVAALAAVVITGAVPVAAQTPDLAAGPPGEEPAPDDLPGLLAALADPAHAAWRRTEREILRAWSRSGSPSMDLLLQRGRQAMREGDHAAAIEHLTALVDHAPDFAEGWNARATAFYNAGQYGPAVDDIARTLTLNPNHWGALSGLGMILEETGRKEAALGAYRAALAIHPHLESIRERAERLERETQGQDI
jgi:tetratricopeptide (TPR) repeat protein